MVEQHDPVIDTGSLSSLYERIGGAQLTPAGILDLTIELTRSRDPELAEAIRCCAIPRRFDPRIIGVLRDAKEDAGRNEEILKELLKQTFVIQRIDGDYVYHDTVRDQLLEWWREEPNRERFDEYNRRLAGHYKARQDEVTELQFHFNRVSRLIRRANPDRYLKLVSTVESLIVSPLLEALYHEVLRSAASGYDFFVNQLHNRYEPTGQYGVCLTLATATRDFLRRLPDKSVEDRYFRWLDYYEARLENQQGQFAEAERILSLLRDATGDDVKLKLWVLSELGTSYQNRYMMREARKVLTEELQLALETREDVFNLSTSYSRVGSINWTLDELDDSVRHYEQAVLAAKDSGNRNQEARARLSLGGILHDHGRRADGLEVDLEAVDLVRAQSPENPGLAYAVAQRLMSDMEVRDPRLVDAFFAEGLELLRAQGDVRGEILLRNEYVSTLSDSGRVTPADTQLEKAKIQAESIGDVVTACQLVFAEGLLRSAQGRSLDSIRAYDRVVELSEAGQGNEWVRAAAVSNRGQQYSKLARWEEAERDFEAASERWEQMGHDNLVAFIQAMRADARRWELLYKEAQRRSSPDSESATAAQERARGDVRLREGDWDAAVEHYRAALDLLRAAGDLREVAELHEEMANIADGRGQWAEAAMQAQAAVEAWTALAADGAPPGDSPTALEPQELEPVNELLAVPLAQLTESSPAYYAGCCRSQGTTYVAQGRWEEARQQLLKAQDIERRLRRLSSAALVDSAIARAYAGEGDWDRAVAAMSAARAFWQELADFEAYQPTEAEDAAAHDNSRGHRNLVSAAGDREALVRGRDLIRSAVNKAEGIFLYHLNLAYACARLEEWAEAGDALDTALQRKPPDASCAALCKRLADYRIKYGLAALSQGKTGEAAMAFSTARLTLENLGDEGLAPLLTVGRLWIDAADGLLRSRNVDEAEACYRAAAEWARKNDSDEDRLKALARLAFLCAVAGRDDEAVEGLVEVVRGETGSATLSSFVDDWVPWFDTLASYRALAHVLRRLSLRLELETDHRARALEARKKLASEFLSVSARAAGSGDPAATPTSTSMMSVVTPIAIELHGALLPTDPNWENTHPFLQQYVPDMRERILDELGVRVPGVRTRVNSDDLPENSYILMLHEVPIVLGYAQPGKLFCGNPLLASLQQVVPESNDVFNPLTGEQDGFWFDPATVDAEKAAALEPLDHFQYMVRHLEHLLRQNLAGFFSISELNEMFERWVNVEGDDSESDRRRQLIATALPDSRARWKLVTVIRALLDEGVTVSALEPILIAFHEHKDEDERAIAEVVRLSQRERLPGNTDGKRFAHLSDDYENTLASGIYDQGAKRLLALEPEPTQELLTAVRMALGDSKRSQVVVVTRRQGIRPYVRKLLELEFPSLAILSEQELLPELRDRVSGTIDLDGEPLP